MDSNESKSHPGFDAAAKSISERQGIPLEEAKAELASSTRHASSSAKKHNPNLKHVKGK